MSHPPKQSRRRAVHSGKHWQTCAPELTTFEQRTPRPPIRSARAATVARFFGIEQQLPSAATTAPTLSATERCDLRRGELRDLLPRAGQILLLTGPSGAGKSTLLRALCEAAARYRMRWSDLDLDLPDVPVIDCLGGRAQVQRVMELLSRVGLAEAWTYLRTPAELSEGQRWRLRLAMCLAALPGRAVAEIQSRKSENSRQIQRRASEAAKRGGGGRSILACDEFAALLDRITACVVARSLRKTIDSLSHDRPGDAPGVIIATSHDDLVRALAPDVVVQCDFARFSAMRVHKCQED